MPHWLNITCKVACEDRCLLWRRRKSVKCCLCVQLVNRSSCPNGIFCRLCMAFRGNPPIPNVNQNRHWIIRLALKVTHLLLLRITDGVTAVPLVAASAFFWFYRSTEALLRGSALRPPHPVIFIKSPFKHPICPLSGEPPAFLGDNVSEQLDAASAKADFPT